MMSARRLPAASGGMLLISDDMSLLDQDAGRLFQEVARIGVIVDEASQTMPPLPADLMAPSSVQILSSTVPKGTIQLLLNMSDAPQRTEASEHVCELAPHSGWVVE